MVTVKCFHKFFSHCMVRYVDSKLQTSQVPIWCPQIGCEHYMSIEECKAFLPDNCFEALLKSLAEENIPDSKRVYCPFPNFLGANKLPDAYTNCCQGDSDFTKNGENLFNSRILCYSG